MKNKLIEYRKLLLDCKRLIIIKYIEEENKKRFEPIILNGKAKVKMITK